MLDRGLLGFVLLWFAVGGVAHFVATDAFIAVVPPSVPKPRLMVLVSGASELLGAAGLLVGRTRAFAALGLALLTVCVTPANVYMWQHAERFAFVPRPWLALRLGFQVVLVAMILRVAWQARSRNSGAGSPL